MKKVIGTIYRGKGVLLLILVLLNAAVVLAEPKDTAKADEEKQEVLTAVQIKMKDER